MIGGGARVGMGACGGADPAGVVIRNARYLGCLLWSFGYNDHRYNGIALDTTAESVFGKSKAAAAASGVASIGSGSGSSITGAGGGAGGGGGGGRGVALPGGGGIIAGGAPVAAGGAAMNVPVAGGGGPGGSEDSVDSSDDDTSWSRRGVGGAGGGGGPDDDDDADSNRHGDGLLDTKTRAVALQLVIMGACSPRRKSRFRCTCAGFIQTCSSSPPHLHFRIMMFNLSKKYSFRY